MATLTTSASTSPTWPRRLINDYRRHRPHISLRRTTSQAGQDAAGTIAVAYGLRLICRRTGDTVVVQASGEVDMYTAPDLAAALRAVCGPGPLVIDLSGIRFLSAAGLTSLLTTRWYCREQQLTLRVVATQRSVLRPLRITGLDTLFDITPTLDEATQPHGA